MTIVRLGRTHVIPFLLVVAGLLLALLHLALIHSSGLLPRGFLLVEMDGCGGGQTSFSIRDALGEAVDCY
jgi:hypothetical protein